MPSALSHPVPALVLGAAFRSPRFPSIVLVAGALCSLAPDVDVLFLPFGVRQDSMFGHRGITHSLPFAAAFGAVVAAVLRAYVPGVSRRTLWLYLAASTASHGVLDALTNGGSAIAFFAPFSDSRYFFPFRPIGVSPLSIGRFLSERGASVLASELMWIWLPWFACAVLAIALRRKYGEPVGPSRPRRSR